MLPDGSPGAARRAHAGAAGRRVRRRGRRRRRAGCAGPQLRAAATAVVGRLLAGDVPAATTVARTLCGLAAGPAPGRVVGPPGGAGERSSTSASPERRSRPPGGDLVHVSVNNVGAQQARRLRRPARGASTCRSGPDAATVVQRVALHQRARPTAWSRTSPACAATRASWSAASSSRCRPGATSSPPAVDGKPWAGTLHTGGERQRLTHARTLPRGATSLARGALRAARSDGRLRPARSSRSRSSSTHARLSLRGCRR